MNFSDVFFMLLFASFFNIESCANCPRGCVDICEYRDTRHLIYLCHQRCICPAIDGKWSSWQMWSSCFPECHTHSSRRSRIRECDNPPPSNGGSMCRGKSRMEESCSCIVDGNWGQWGTWSNCYPACFTEEHRYKKRSRSCDSPSPELGGQYCHGNHSQKYLCLACRRGSCDKSKDVSLRQNDYISLQISFNKKIDENSNPLLQGCNWTFHNDVSALLVLYLQSIILVGSDRSRRLYFEDEFTNNSAGLLELQQEYEGKSISFSKAQTKLILQTTESVDITIAARIFDKVLILNETEDVLLPQLGYCFSSNIKWTVMKFIPEDSRVKLRISQMRFDPDETIEISSEVSKIIIIPQLHIRKESYTIPIYGRTLNITVNTNKFIKCRRLEMHIEEEYIPTCYNRLTNTTYAGQRNISVTGHTCIPCNFTSYAEYEEFKYSNIYCRQWNLTDTPWCFVNISGLITEAECDVYCSKEEEEKEMEIPGSIKYFDVPLLWKIFAGIIFLGAVVLIIEIKVLCRKARNRRENDTIEMSVITASTNNNNTSIQTNGADDDNDNDDDDDNDEDIDDVYCDLPDGVYDTAFGIRIKRLKSSNL